jgi:hypothetical protein
MTRTIRVLAATGQRLPSKLGQVCLLLVAVVGCATDPAEPICETRTLRVDTVAVPKNNNLAREFGFDLDADKAIDNNAGMVTATLHAMIPNFDLATATTARLADDIVWEVEVETCDDGTQQVANARMPVSTVFDPAGTFPAAGFVAATRSAIAVTQRADGTWDGKLGMAFAPDALIDATVAPLAPYFDEHQLFMEYLDTSPKDGHITVEEMRKASVVKTMLAPDLGSDGTSFGIAFTAHE